MNRELSHSPTQSFPRPPWVRLECKHGPRAHGDSPQTDIDMTTEEAQVQHKTRSRQLENLKMLSSPDQVKGIFTEIVTGGGEVPISEMRFLIPFRSSAPRSLRTGGVPSLRS